MDNMKDTTIEAGKGFGMLTWAYAVLDWLFSVPLDQWVTILAMIGAMCGITAYIFDIRKKRLEIRLLEQRFQEGDDGQ